MTKQKYCSKCGGPLLKDATTGKLYCPVHLTDMKPVTGGHKKAKAFKKKYEGTSYWW